MTHKKNTQIFEIVKICVRCDVFVNFMNGSYEIRKNKKKKEIRKIIFYFFFGKYKISNQNHFFVDFLSMS